MVVPSRTSTNDAPLEDALARFAFTDPGAADETFVDLNAVSVGISLREFSTLDDLFAAVDENLAEAEKAIGLAPTPNNQASWCT